MQAPKGVRIKGVTLKAVPKGTLPPPPEAIQTDITSVVHTMFQGRKKAVTVPSEKSGIRVKKVTAILPQQQQKKPELPEETVPEETVPEETAPEETAPAEESIPEETAPQQPPPQETKGREGVSPELLALQAQVVNKEKTDVYSLKHGTIFTPESSRAFTKYITTTFSEFALPPRLGPINYEACSNMEYKTYKYQEFIREYMRSASPYRGVLVYHGLGSGKTCTSIAAAEALYGASSKKIIVLTPNSLQENFITEITSCGFQHFHYQNHWEPFSLTDSASRLFAKEVVGIPEIYIKYVLRKAPSDRVFWMPDFTKPPNYDSLTESQQTAIRLQIRKIIENRITLLGYTGLTHDRLKQIACDKPNFFDDAIIVIDEVHNLTRLMRGKLDRYLKNVMIQPTATGKKPKKIPFSYEPVDTETWKPKLCGSSQKYDRAFLFYRLLSQAKRSKIIALSGTPIVNFPEEIGILCNILHGYFHTVTDALSSVKNEDIAQLENILKLHPRIEYYSLTKSEGFTEVFFSRLEEGYIKSFIGEELQGVVEAPGATPNTIQEIYMDVLKQASSAGLTFKNKPRFSALPLFPETIEDFTSTFVDTTNFHIKNKLLFQKRISGLVSYYKGAKKELMPEVVRDEVLEVPMSAYALGPYAEARSKEREEKSKSSSGSAWNELGELASESSSTSYRFRSRAACNFVFPKGIPRPFPTKKKDFKDAGKVEETFLGDKDADVTEDDAVSVAIEEEEEVEAEQEAEEEEATAEGPSIATNNSRIPYKERVKMALDALRSVAPRRFKLDPSAPVDQQLKTYSGKFVAIMERMKASPGSNLIYSQFKTLEGIGILSIVLDTNGYAPLRLVGSDEDLAFAPETKESLRTRPEQPRYIIYSGEETKKVRQTLINIFNTKMSALPPKILSVLNDSGLIDPVTRRGNFKGEICKAFMITGAGAEGLSLRNVRTVHIMEPYWNSVRTDQVKGRAVRICSHSDLPYSSNPAENQRTVEIYTYISKIDESMKKARIIDQTLITQDDGITTDQHILGLSKAKDQLSQDFIQAMKASAVDCILNQTENEPIACFMYDGKVSDFLYDPRIKEDQGKTEREMKNIRAQPALPPATTVAQQQPPSEPIAVPAQEPPKYPIVSYHKKYYIAVPKKANDGSEYKGLYDVQDRLLKKELAKYYTGPDGKKKVEFYPE
jgi:hypothetical protein